MKLISSVDFLNTLITLLSGALKLDPVSFKTVLGSSDYGTVTLVLLFMAGISLTLGQSVVLFIHRVSPRQFIISLILWVFIFVTATVFWVITIWWISSYFFNSAESLSGVFRIISLSHAPLIFGFFVLIPIVGIALLRILYVWTFLAVIVSIRVGLHLDIWQALICSVGGWLVFELLYHLLGKPFASLENVLWYKIIGTSQKIEIKDMIQLFINRYKKK